MKVGNTVIGGYTFYSDNLLTTSYLENLIMSNRTNALFRGELVNCEIDGFTRFGDGWSLAVDASSILIRNCKILGSQSSYGIDASGGNVQITHTLLYAGINGTNVSPDYNIIEYRY